MRGVLTVFCWKYNLAAGTLTKNWSIIGGEQTKERYVSLVYSLGIPDYGSISPLGRWGQQHSNKAMWKEKWLISLITNSSWSVSDSRLFKVPHLGMIKSWQKDIAHQDWPWERINSLSNRSSFGNHFMFYSISYLTSSITMKISEKPNTIRLIGIVQINNGKLWQLRTVDMRSRIGKSHVMVRHVQKNRKRLCNCCCDMKE